MKKLLVLFLVVSSTISLAQESVLLRLNYKKGDKYIMSMNMSQNMGTMMSMNMSMKMSQEITNVTGEEYVSEMKIANMKMDMNQGGMSMNFDSSKSDDELDDAGKMMKSQMGPMLKAVITSKGNNLGEVLSTTVEPNTPGTSDLTKQSSNVVYPKNKVKVGDVWSVKKDENGTKMDINYKVKSINKTEVLIEVTGEISGNSTGTMRGKINISKMSGVPINSNINMDMEVQGQKMKRSISILMTKK